MFQIDRIPQKNQQKSLNYRMEVFDLIHFYIRTLPLHNIVYFRVYEEDKNKFALNR